jgi:hypothetical protein
VALKGKEVKRLNSLNYVALEELWAAKLL